MVESVAGIINLGVGRAWRPLNVKLMAGGAPGTQLRGMPDFFHILAQEGVNNCLMVD